MFDHKRFLRLLAVHWAEHSRSYAWFFAVGIGVHCCVWLLLTSGGLHASSYNNSEQMAVYVCGYLLSSLLFAGRYYAALAQPDSALTLLMRPASAFEKALLAVLMVAVFYPLAYTLAFQVCNLPGAWWANASREALAATLNANAVNAGHLSAMHSSPYVPFTATVSPWLELDVLLGGTSLQALVVMGALYFKRLAWLKTLVALFVLVVVAIPLLAVLSDAAPDKLFWSTTEAGPSPLLAAWKGVLWLGVPGLFWLSTYFFLRERELH